MSGFFRLHFGSSNSKRYPQALELAKLANHHEIPEIGNGDWHIVSFTEFQVDLMWAMYNLTRNMQPKIYGADISSIYSSLPSGIYNYYYASKRQRERVFHAVQELKKRFGEDKIAKIFKEKFYDVLIADMQKVNNFFEEKGYWGEWQNSDDGAGLFRIPKKVKEFVPEYQIINDLISQNKHQEAIQIYYNTLGDRFYGELHNELIYLKRLAQIPLTGRDLLYFRNESTRSDLINSCLAEYVSCIDNVLKRYREAGLKLPLDIILENAPTMEELIDQKESKTGIKEVSYRNEQFLRTGGNRPITIESFSAKYNKCLTGRLFNRYPDQVQYCRALEIPEELKKVKGFWTTCSPAAYKREILDKELHLVWIDIYQYNFQEKDEKAPGFQTITSLSGIEKFGHETEGINYTGKTHIIEGKVFYEVDLLRSTDFYWLFENAFVEDYGNPFIEYVEEILREAENLLREKHGLPKIGEGWISEMKLYNLVKTIFPDVIHHASPDWLKPQHLDIYVPSKNLAFEYQGIQHFEPIDFFGGEEAFKLTIKRDRKKEEKCRVNNVRLIYWRYDEPIEKQLLIKKIEIK